MAIGRISGPLLKSNLLRDGVDLAFETDLLYLDVTNRRIGIKTTTPQYPLDVDGQARITDLEITNPILPIGNVTIDGDNGIISTTAQEFRIATTDSIIIGNRVLIGDLEINDSFIENTNTNDDLYIRANGTGTINIEGNTVITGNLHATGNITADGDIQIGDDDTDTITINAEIASDIVPDANDTYTIGTADKRWATAYINTTFTDTITTDDINFGDIDLVSTPGNIIYVAQNGSDTATGAHPQDPVATIEYALSLASSGDTVYVYPGTYQEVFPLTVGQGVTVRGQSIRSVEITPDSTSQSEDVFLMNGESTVEEVTIKNFFYDSGNDTGYAFRFAPNFSVTLRSPYVRNVSVITQGTTTTSEDPRGFDAGDAGQGVFLDGSVADADSREASMLFHSVTFITPGVTALKATNGARIEWLNCFTYFADKGVNLYDSADGLKGVGKTKLKVAGLVGTPAGGQTIDYYDTDGVTVLATATVDSVDGNYIYIDGKVTGFELPPTRARKTISVKGNAQISTAAPKYGTGCLLLDGDSDYIDVTSQTDFGFSAGDFTVEAWVRLNSVTGTQVLFDLRAGSTTDTGIVAYFDDANLVVDVGETNLLSPGTTFTTGTYWHIAVSRFSGTTRVFVNGTAVSSTADANDYGTTKPLVFGSDYDGLGDFLSARIDDIRIRTAGYSTNFTAPTAALPVTSTTVLKLEFDGDDGSIIILDNDVFEQDIRFSGGATATSFELVDHSDFGAEIRSIGSASVYGNYGFYTDGPGVVGYLIGQNLAYIGNKKETDNDPTTVQQDQEIVKLNDAKIYYSTVDHKGDFRVGDLFTVNQETGEVSFTNAEFLFNNNEGITFTDGVNTTIIDGSKVETGNIRISGNTVESISGDLNLDSATSTINLTDTVNVSGDLDVTGNVTIGGNITLGDEATDSIQFTAAIESDILPSATDTYNLGSSSLNWQELHTGKVIVDTLEINDNYIKSTSSDGDIELITNATGEVVIDDIRISDNVIRNTTGTIVLDASSDVVEIDGTGSLILPKGDTSERPGTPELGMIRFNTDTSVFEAYDGTWTELGGVYDDDRDTYITPELTPGANDNTIRFYAGGVLVADVTPERFDANTILVDDIQISGNTLQTITTNTDLILQANGTGTIAIEDFAFNGSTITNTVEGAVTTLRQEGTGYFKVEGNGGFVIPVGNNENRHPTPETGMMRYNFVEDRVEIYDIGNNWVSVAGSTGAVSFNDAEDIAVKFALTL
jgi:hypothetical protein